VCPLLVRLLLPRDRQLPRQEGLRLQSERAYLRLQVHLRLLLRGLFFRQPVRGLCVRLFLGANCARRLQLRCAGAGACAYAYAAAAALAQISTVVSPQQADEAVRATRFEPMKFLSSSFREK
jgi:hypothetical protein